MIGKKGSQALKWAQTDQNSIDICISTNIAWIIRCSMKIIKLQPVVKQTLIF